MSRLQFELITTDGVARRGRLTFPRGTIETPAFMPVGTYGTVKGVLPEQARALGAEIILGNTFHLSESTLLMLVSAFAGKDRVFAAYDHAVQAEYRFFSYGDAMLLWGAHAPAA